MKQTKGLLNRSERSVSISYFASHYKEAGDRDRRFKLNTLDLILLGETDGADKMKATKKQDE